MTQSDELERDLRDAADADADWERHSLAEYLINRGWLKAPAASEDVTEKAARVLFDANRRRFLNGPCGFLGAASWEHADPAERRVPVEDARDLASAGLLARAAIEALGGTAMSVHERLDAYAAGDPADGDYGPNFQRQQAAPEAFAALRAVLDLADHYKTWKRIENGESVRALNIEKVRRLIAEPDSDSDVEYWKQRALIAEAKLREVADAIMGIGGQP